MTGKIYGRLTILELDKTYKYIGHGFKWICRCECGNIKSINGNSIRQGRTTSCGCYRNERIRETNTTHGLTSQNKEYREQRSKKHGMSSLRIHKIWRDMISRCYSKSDYHYQWYGEKGIMICDLWRNKEYGFVNFYNWAIDNGYNDKLTIDRINVSGNYEPKNCRWATHIEQCHNRGLSKRNKSGYTGVHYDKQNHKYIATITNNYKQIKLGYFNDIESAIKARKKAEIKYWNKKEGD